MWTMSNGILSLIPQEQVSVADLYHKRTPYLTAKLSWRLCYNMFCRNIVIMLIQKSNTVSSVIPFSSSAIDNLWHAGQELNGSTIAGVSAGNHAIGGCIPFIDMSVLSRLDSCCCFYLFILLLNRLVFWTSGYWRQQWRCQELKFGEL